MLVALHERHRLFAQGLVSALGERAITAVPVADAAELECVVRQSAPDAVLLDAGAAADPELAAIAQAPGTSLLLLTHPDDPPHRPLPPGLIVDRRTGVDGVTRALRGDEPVLPSSNGRRNHGLTDAEIGILTLVGAGMTAREISEQLSTHPKVVERNKQRIFTKLGVQTQAHAMAVAIRAGLLATNGDLGAAFAGSPTDDVVAAVLAPVRLDRDAVAAALAAEGITVTNERGASVGVLVEPGLEEWASIEHWRAGTIVIRRNLGDDTSVLGALLSGADAVYDADIGCAELAQACRTVGQGGTLLTPRHQRLVVDAARARVSAPDHDDVSLTQRERDILNSIARGESVKETARGLGVSPKTVETVQRTLFRKLGARNRAQAVTKALVLGLILILLLTMATPEVRRITRPLVDQPVRWVEDVVERVVPQVVAGTARRLPAPVTLPLHATAAAPTSSAGATPEPGAGAATAPSPAPAPPPARIAPTEPQPAAAAPSFDLSIALTAPVSSAVSSLVATAATVDAVVRSEHVPAGAATTVAGAPALLLASAAPGGV